MSPFGPAGPGAPACPLWFQVIFVSNAVQWLIRFRGGSDGSISLTVPMFFSMQPVYTLPLSGIVAYAIPPARANSTAATANNRSQRRVHR